MQTKLARFASVILCSVMIAGSASSLRAQTLQSVRGPFVNSKSNLTLVLEFDGYPQEKIKPSTVYLQNGAGEKLYCASTYDTTTSRFVRFVFDVNAASFAFFESLISDSAGYFLYNEESIRFSNGAIESGALESLTKNMIHTISQEKWDEYILNEYSAQYLFPHSFEAGTQLGTEDSTKTVYYIGLVQSGSWYNSGSLSAFWGLKGRWSTDAEDKLNYLTFYPVTLLFDNVNWRVAVGTGVETGYQGFGKFGRAALRGDFQYRLPFNLVDLTLGNPRWRINPVVNLSVQGSYGWGNVTLPDSLRKSFDATLGLRYDIPVAKQYYLQTSARLNYSTVTSDLLYQYGISLGYIAGGEVRIAFRYEQGYQDVSYQYDKKLLLGFAFDVLNLSGGK
ncbi:MAG TPA: hypothetical protein VII11_09415 [Bacteroidota bacterium]